jgi:hypothetical protein
MEYNPLSKLDAVNICLNAKGEPKVTDLASTGVDAEEALDLITETSRSIQLKGWYWNKEQYTLSPDGSGFIQLPGNTASVRTMEENLVDLYVQRGTRLYNLKDHTFVFTVPVKVELTLMLDWDDLTATMKMLVTARAATILQERTIGAPDLDAYIKTWATDAWNDLVRDENRVRRPNMLRDNWSTNQIVQREFYRAGAWRSGV